ncbi:NAD(P)-binding protein [Setomelanomma holmii]|uniref:NAD(P)-binding protein n=1 Tax=Setomelanomma holmii TaxID=210430 RepID=A0A9P4HHS8_9PLEO|nr:NAD(P)-binding protein [Setomelanomma holmii]
MAPYTLPSSAVWFITGCSSGIGYTLCHYLATHTQHRIVATARNVSTLTSLPSTPNILKVTLDVTSESSIHAAIAATLRKWHRIDIAVNNAGYGLHAHTELVSPDCARKLMDTNFWSAVRITQLLLPIMRDTNPLSGPRGGLFVQMSSGGGRQAFPGGAFYHTSKFALEGFSEALSKEVPEEWGIRVLIVEPGGVKTRYAETSVKMAGEGEGEVGDDSVYADPRLPANVLRAYVADPEARKNWAEVERVVEVLYKFVEKGGDMLLRLPLGSDSWAMQVEGAKASLEALEELKEVSCSTSGEEQARSIAFLTGEIKR